MMMRASWRISESAKIKWCGAKSFEFEQGSCGEMLSFWPLQASLARNNSGQIFDFSSLNTRKWLKYNKMFKKLNTNYQWGKPKILQMGTLIACFVFAFNSFPPLIYYFTKFWGGSGCKLVLFTRPTPPVGLQTHLRGFYNTKCLFISSSKNNNLCSSSFRQVEETATHMTEPNPLFILKDLEEQFWIWFGK